MLNIQHFSKMKTHGPRHFIFSYEENEPIRPKLVYLNKNLPSIEWQKPNVSEMHFETSCTNFRDNLISYMHTFTLKDLSLPFFSFAMGGKLTISLICDFVLTDLFVVFFSSHIQYIYCSVFICISFAFPFNFHFRLFENECFIFSSLSFSSIFSFIWTFNTNYKSTRATSNRYVALLDDPS